MADFQDDVNFIDINEGDIVESTMRLEKEQQAINKRFLAFDAAQRDYFWKIQQQCPFNKNVVFAEVDEVGIDATEFNFNNPANELSTNLGSNHDLQNTPAETTEPTTKWSKIITGILKCL